MKKTALFILLSGLLMLLVSCTHGHCRSQNSLPVAGAEAAQLQNNPESVKDQPIMDKKLTAGDKVKVYKADGSLQCGMGKAISVSEMQKQLGKIKVYKSENKNDGMMRIQMCGAPTGQCNVYEIEKSDLESAQKAGFKEWTFE